MGAGDSDRSYLREFLKSRSGVVRARHAGSSVGDLASTWSCHPTVGGLQVGQPRGLAGEPGGSPARLGQLLRGRRAADGGPQPGLVVELDVGRQPPPTAPRARSRGTTASRRATSPSPRASAARPTRWWWSGPSRTGTRSKSTVSGPVSGTSYDLTSTYFQQGVIQYIQSQTHGYLGSVTPDAGDRGALQRRRAEPAQQHGAAGDIRA